MQTSAKIKTGRFLLAMALIIVARAAEPRSEAQLEREREANYREYAARISALTSRVESFIAEELVRKKGASEYPPARRYALRDLDGDGKDDLFLITTFEPLSGGNYHESHLFAVLTSCPGEVQPFVVDGRGWRDADRFKEGGTRLFLQFKVWAKVIPSVVPVWSQARKSPSTKAGFFCAEVQGFQEKVPSLSRIRCQIQNSPFPASFRS